MGDGLNRTAFAPSSTVGVAAGGKSRRAADAARVRVSSSSNSASVIVEKESSVYLRRVEEPIIHCYEFYIVKLIADVEADGGEEFLAPQLPRLLGTIVRLLSSPHRL